MSFIRDERLGGKMENELNTDCTITRGVIDRLARAESVSDEETAQIILHTERCEGCKTYLTDALQMEKPTGSQE